MALSVAQRTLLMKKFDALAGVLKNKIDASTVAHNSGAYRLLVQVAGAMSNPQDNKDTEKKVEALITNIANGTLDLGEITTEVTGALQTAQDTFSAPGGCKSFFKSAGHTFVSCCCVISSSVASVLGPVGREIAIEFVNARINQMKITDAAKIAMKAANKTAMTAAVGGFIATLDGYAESHREELQNNVYVSQALTIMQEIDLIELLPNGTVTIAGQAFNAGEAVEDILADARADMERAAKIDDEDGSGAATATAAAATPSVANNPTNVTQAQITTLQKAAALIAANRSGDSDTAISIAELTELRHTMKTDLETRAKEDMAASRTGIHKKLAAELRKVPGFETFTNDLAVELLHDTFERTMESMPDVVSSMFNVRNFAMRWKNFASVDIHGEGAAAAAGSGEGAAAVGPDAIALALGIRTEAHDDGAGVGGATLASLAAASAGEGEGAGTAAPMPVTGAVAEVAEA